MSPPALACDKTIHSAMEMWLYCKRHVVNDWLSIRIKLASIDGMETFVMATLTNNAIMFYITVELAIATHFRNWESRVDTDRLVLLFKSLSLE